MLKKSILKKSSILLLFIISIISSSFFIGLNLVSLSMQNAYEKYYNDINLMDLKLTSNIGFSKNDELLIKKQKDVDGVMLIKSLNIKANIKDSEFNVKVNSISKNRSKKDKNYINHLTLTSGKYPSTINEGLVEEKLLEKNNIKVGDLITLIPDDNNDLKAKKIKIVGTVNNNFISSINEYNIYLEENDFNTPYYNEGYVTLKRIDKYTLNSKKYKNYVNKNKKAILNIIEISSKEKYDYETNNLKNDINELENNLNNLYSSLVPQELLNESIKEISNELNTKKDSLKNIKAPYSAVLEKEEISSFNNLNLKAKEIKIVSNTYSILYILLQTIFIINLSLNTINKIYNFKNYNYDNKKNTLTYISYIFLLNILGVFLGSIIFYKVIFKIIIYIYTLLYKLPIYISTYKTNYMLRLFIYNLLIIIFTGLISYLYIIFRNNIKNYRVFSNLYNKLNYLTKITVKSILNQKRKIIINCLLIATFASSILLLFNIKSSIYNTSSFQYNKIYKYNLLLKINNNNNNDNLKSLENIIKDDKNSKKLFLNNISIKSKKDKTIINTNLNVIENNKNIKDFMELKKEKINNNDVIISKRLAKDLNVKENDYIVLNINNKNIKVKVTCINYDYVNNLIYITKDKFKKLTKEDTSYNTLLVISKNNKMINNLENNENVLAYESTKNKEEIFINSTYSLISFTLTITILLSLFFILIFYNILSKNIKLRKKYIYKIKQEGIKGKEIFIYFYKEIIIMVILGSLISFIIGTILTKFIINQFSLYVFYVNAFNYLLTFIITFLLVSIIYIILYFKKIYKII